jgi:hypothetical protein
MTTPEPFDGQVMRALGGLEAKVEAIGGRQDRTDRRISEFVEDNEKAHDAVWRRLDALEEKLDVRLTRIERMVWLACGVGLATGGGVVAAIQAAGA